MSIVFVIISTMAVSPSDAPLSICPTSAQLPLFPGEVWWFSQGWGGSVSHGSEEAWDANFGSGDADLGRPILAGITGKVAYAAFGQSDYGREVIVVDENIRNDEGCFLGVRTAHQNEIYVKVGEEVSQGQVLGTCGGSGIRDGRKVNDRFGIHSHFNFMWYCAGTDGGNFNSSRAAIPCYVNYIHDGQNYFGNPPDCACPPGSPAAEDKHRSGNTFLFDEKYQSLGGPAFFGDMLPDHTDPGNPTGIHWYSPFNSTDKRNAYIIDYTGNANRCGASMPAALVYDALNGARNVYSVICGFAKWWFANGGPKSVLGMPVGDVF